MPDLDTVLDFSDADTVAAFKPVNDVVMGGNSQGRLEPTPQGAHFTGEVVLEGGGFASVRANLSFDLSAYNGVRLRVKGDGQRYQLRFTTSASRVVYTATFDTRRFDTGADAWLEPDIEFTTLEATFRGRNVPNAPRFDPADITSVGLLIAERQGGRFSLYIANLRATPFRATPFRATPFRATP